MTGWDKLRAVVTAMTLGVFVAGAAIGAGVGSARAATLDLAALGYDRDAEVAFTNIGSVAVGAVPGAPGILQLFATDPGFELTLDSLDLADPAQAAFAVFGPNFAADELSGTGASAFGTDETGGLVQFLFTGALGTGAYAPFDEEAVLVELQVARLLPFLDGFVSSGDVRLTFTVLRTADPGVIPLPAGLPLLLAGLGALVVLRGTRRQP